MLALPEAGEAPAPGRCRRRYAAATAFALCNAANAFLWICFAPVVEVTARRFRVSVRSVNQLSLLFLYLYAPGYLLSVYVTTRYGLRANVCVGALLNAACAWVRFAATAPSAGFGLLAAGQALGALAQPAFTNTPALLALEWCAVGPACVSAALCALFGLPLFDSLTRRFPPHEREHAVVWTSVANIVGNAAGSAIPGLVAASERGLDGLLLYQAVTFSLLCAVTLAVLARPIGEATAVTGAASTGSGRAALRRVFAECAALLRNRAYWPLCAAFAIGIGLFNALLTLVAQLLQPCGYGADAASYTGGALLVSGLVCAGLAGAVMARAPHAAVRLQKGLVAALLAALIGMLACLRRGALAPLVVTWGALGGALIPLLPVSLENAAALAAPVSPDAAAGVMLLAGQWMGVAYVYALPPLLALPASAACGSVATPAAAFLVANMCVACAAISALKFDDRRKGALAAADVTVAA
jgi:hypothetical protein